MSRILDGLFQFTWRAGFMVVPDRETTARRNERLADRLTGNRIGRTIRVGESRDQLLDSWRRQGKPLRGLTCGRVPPTPVGSLGPQSVGSAPTHPKEFPPLNLTFSREKAARPARGRAAGWKGGFAPCLPAVAAPRVFPGMGRRRFTVLRGGDGLPHGCASRRGGHRLPPRPYPWRVAPRQSPHPFRGARPR